MKTAHRARLRAAEAFIFDFYGTLAIHDDAPTPMWQVLTELGYNSAHHLQAMWDSDAFDGSLTPGAAAGSDYEAWRRGNLKEFVRLSGVPEELLDETVTQLLEHAQQATFKPIAGAATLLKLLREHGKKLGVCSNWDYPLQEELARVKLPPFDAITISWEAGARKPNAAIFHDICAKLDVRPAAAVYIGDSWSADVVGAIRADLMPVWLHRDAETNPLPHHVAAFETLQAFEAAMKQVL